MTFGLNRIPTREGAPDPRRRVSLWKTLLGIGFGAGVASLFFTSVAVSFASEAPQSSPEDVAAAEHRRLFEAERYPSATACRTCHPGHYREWSVSQHAYAQLSPIFNTMHATVVKRTNGSNGDFCVRCHTQVGMNLEEPVFMSNMDRNPVSREGITCVVCHRLENEYGKISGRFALVEGGLNTPVYGPTGAGELKRVLDDQGSYQLTTDPAEQGRVVHADVEHAAQLSTSGFCGTCHDVTLKNGFRLEEAFSEFKNSPAAARGETCQDCHMGKVPGKKSGYRLEPAAVVGGMPTAPRRRTNHMFPGPDYSVIHPGLFPHNPQAAELATMREWLSFDHEAGWGTDAYEKSASKDVEYPSRWRTIDDRYDGRAVIDSQMELLAEMKEQRLAILREGYRLGELKVRKASKRGLKFEVEVRNGTDGHNVPTGFDAERLTWLRVAVTGPDGKTVFQSGDLDPNGDVRDLHSHHVHDGMVPLDKQLFSLQSRFLTRNLRGGEREQVLPINYSLDPLPFVRPEPFSVILTGRPSDARKHKRGIGPLERRIAAYHVKRSALTGAGDYRINVKLKAAMVPVNLVLEIADLGFDYHMTTGDVIEALVAGHMTLWDRTVTVSLDGEKPIFDLAGSPEQARRDGKGN